ncbi:DUF973 family protein [Stygiolobus sp. RP850M]|uniref:DUF973 family protein n=1 Tax=Stygiolobus sp. RP850M TaxID=3133137 RepID=UPI00307E72F9
MNSNRHKLVSITKRSKKGLSGAVTALILVIASVIIALVVVGFAFGLFGSLGGTPTVTQVGTSALSSTDSKGQIYYVATITLHSTGKVQIVSASIVGTNVTASNISPISLSAGLTTVTLTFPKDPILLLNLAPFIR